jgi:hypothetical protein
VTDPTRLIDDPDSLPALRRALRAESKHEPQESLKGAVWAVLAGQIAYSTKAAASAAGVATAQVTAGGAGALGTTSLLSAGVVKSFAVSFAVGLALAAGGPAVVSTLVEGDPPSAVESTVAPQSKTKLAPAGGQPTLADPTVQGLAPNALEATTREPRTSAVPSAPRHRGDSTRIDEPKPARPEEPAASTRVSFPSLARLEAARVSEARQALRQGEGITCLDRLAALDREVSGGVLAQERLALRIEALVAVGRRAEARRAAEAFLVRYPESPHAGRIRGWAEPHAE